MPAPKGHPKWGGRQKGATNRDTDKLRGMILEALDRCGGADYLTRQAEENPGPFMALLAKVLPKDVHMAHEGAVTTAIAILPPMSREEWIARYVNTPVKTIEINPRKEQK
jgi:hypothetical protein